MVSGFLLHDPSDMGIGGVSGERKLSIGGQDVGVALPPGGVLRSGMPPEQKRSTPTFWPLPSGDHSKVSKLERSWAKCGGKSLQLFISAA
jgi:hypothetical protein